MRDDMTTALDSLQRTSLESLEPYGRFLYHLVQALVEAACATDAPDAVPARVEQCVGEATSAYPAYRMEPELVALLRRVVGLLAQRRGGLAARLWWLRCWWASTRWLR